MPADMPSSRQQSRRPIRSGFSIPSVVARCSLANVRNASGLVGVAALPVLNVPRRPFQCFSGPAEPSNGSAPSVAARLSTTIRSVSRMSSPVSGAELRRTMTSLREGTTTTNMPHAALREAGVGRRSGEAPGRAPLRHVAADPGWSTSRRHGRWPRSVCSTCAPSPAAAGAARLAFRRVQQRSAAPAMFTNGSRRSRLPELPNRIPPPQPFQRHRQRLRDGRPVDETWCQRLPGAGRITGDPWREVASTPCEDISHPDADARRPKDEPEHWRHNAELNPFGTLARSGPTDGFAISAAEVVNSGAVSEMPSRPSQHRSTHRGRHGMAGQARA